MGPCVRRDDAEYNAFADSNFKQPRPSLRAQAKQSISPHKERVDCFVAHAPRKDVTHVYRLAAHSRPSPACIFFPQKQRAQGKPGARRTRSLVCKSEKHTSVVTTGLPRSPGLPCAMVLTGSFVLSPVIGLSCHCRKRNAQALSPLDASVEASGPHDFTVRVSAFRQAHPSRPPHPIPHVRDDREPPLFWG
jgi:hypothetical protein